MPLVTAVITTHKREAKIVERALKSVLAQTHTELEVFVVDDSPADYPARNSVREMVESYADRNVTYIAHEKCSGACVARNTGLEACHGEFVAFLDDDDEWLPEKIEKQLGGFVDDEIALVYCKDVIRNEMTGETKERNVEIHTGFVFDSLIKGNYIGSTSFPLLRTAALKEVGGFDPLQQSAQDFDVWLRIAEKYKVNYVDESLIVYYVHDGEQISKGSTKRINGQERIIEKNIEYLKNHRAAYWIRTIKLVPEYAKNKQYGKALGTWFKAVFKCPWKFKANLTYLYSFFRILFESKAKQ